MKSITEPLLLVDEAKVRRNIKRMADRAASNDVEFRPHFKTHQSKAIGNWFRKYGVSGITVSSLRMARYFAEAGWNDITIAFPAIPNHAQKLNKLASKADISILLSNSDVLQRLEESMTRAVSAYIEIDSGSGRTGFSPSQKTELETLITGLKESPKISFKGFYSHPGHSYQCRSKQEIRRVHRQTVQIMQDLREHFESQIDKLTICIGDTPCCSVADNFEGIDQISPGNFVFYDLMQAQIGACSTNDIAVALACPVVAKYPQRNEIAVHGGAIHLSKDKLHENGTAIFGKAVHLNNDFSWGEPINECYVKSLSQEHGIIRCSSPFLEGVSIGDVIGILPVHSCLTADAMKSYTTVDSSTKLDHLQAHPN